MPCLRTSTDPLRRSAHAGRQYRYAAVSARSRRNEDGPLAPVALTGDDDTGAAALPKSRANDGHAARLRADSSSS
jgi:hypothetical protein